MKLYVNGDSHSAGAEAIHSAAFAEDDPKYRGLKRMPHPANLEVSYGAKLAERLGAKLICDAESASSNARILRTSLGYLFDNNNAVFNRPDLAVFGWATWEREEWWDEETQTRWQVNAGGIGHDWPQSIKDKYKQWVIDQMEPETINTKLKGIHEVLYQFHCTLNTLSIPHLFFNTYLDFSHLDNLGVERYDWGGSYIGPYDPNCTYFNWCKAQGFKTATPTSYHFKADAHAAWADYLYAHYVQNLLTR